MKCQKCKNYKATYKVTPKQNLCDYCFALIKWNGQRMVVDEHLSTQESKDLHKKAVEDFLKLKVHTLLPMFNDRERILFSNDLQRMVRIVKESYPKLADFCAQHNVSLHDLRTALRD